MITFGRVGLAARAVAAEQRGKTELGPGTETGSPGERESNCPVQLSIQVVVSPVLGQTVGLFPPVVASTLAAALKVRVGLHAVLVAFARPHGGHALG